MEYWKLGNYVYLFYYSLLRQWAKEFRQELTLDAGCGKGRDYFKFTNSVGVDIDRNNIKRYVKAGGTGVLGTITQLPFKTDAFETAVCIDVLEHVELGKQATAELGRVVKGALIGSTSNLLNPYMFLDTILPKAVIRKLRPIIGQHYNRHHRFTVSRLAVALTNAGFVPEIVVLDHPPFQAQLYNFESSRLPWYAYVWIVTTKLSSKIIIMRDMLVFRAIKGPAQGFRLKKEGLTSKVNDESLQC